ncbi:LysR family transcriptional regulator, partial [Pseudomonas sp.]|uniref:LysR family transcriptional regulator n=1 Tax=Pseudomonas sp. TaxID=306 RepID=UPI0025868812
MESVAAISVFVQVAEIGSFVGAGRALGVSASAVGKRIARLEETLGVPLFKRTTRSVTLTVDGQRLLDRSRRIIEEF